MLPPITKRFADHSTDREFRFEFFCDKCGAVWKSDVYPFYLRDAPCGNEGESRAREILWKADHNAAYERANNEAAMNFNRCRKCGLRFCDDCFSEFELICTDCAKKK